MSQPSVQERIAALERQVAELRAAQANGATPTGWRSSVGMFTGDVIVKRIDEAARKFRESDRRRGRSRGKAKAKAQK